MTQRDGRPGTEGRETQTGVATRHEGRGVGGAPERKNRGRGGTGAPPSDHLREGLRQEWGGGKPHTEGEKDTEGDGDAMGTGRWEEGSRGRGVGGWTDGLT